MRDPCRGWGFRLSWLAFLGLSLWVVLAVLPGAVLGGVVGYLGCYRGSPWFALCWLSCLLTVDYAHPFGDA